MLVTHANTKWFGLTSLSGVRRGFMSPQLKNKHFKGLTYLQFQRKFPYVERICLSHCSALILFIDIPDALLKMGSDKIDNLLTR
jgi:hypothetical protein